MTYGNAKEFITEFLRGDKSNPDITPIHFKMAIMEVATLCIPSNLKAIYDASKTDVFRMLHAEEVRVTEHETKDVPYYIKNPIVASPIVDTDDMEIDQQLGLAVVFFICSYLSNKYTDRYEAKATKQVSIYVSNEIA